MVTTDFWKSPIVLEEMTPEDKIFYLFLLTNPETTQTGIYKITKKELAFYLGYSIETIHTLMERFTKQHKLIRYNPETREIAIKNWGKFNLHRGGKPIMDCLFSESREVEDTSLIRYVSERIPKQEIRSLYESFCGKEDIYTAEEMADQDVNDTYVHTESEEFEDTSKEQQVLERDVENHPDIENSLQNLQNDGKEIIEFWDNNGFGFSNVNAKQQLLSWLDDASFLQPKEMILKAMNIACANNKRRLNYVVGILKNWENESLLTVEEVENYQENQKPASYNRPFAPSIPTGRDVPRDFVLDLTAGEKQ
jgi:DnaD/phage-associated family protein